MIVLAVRWYLRFGLSYRDVEELLAERGIEVDHVTVHRWVRPANNRVEADHAQLKRRLNPMRGIKTMTGLRIVAAGHAFVQNLRRGHYEIATDEPAGPRLAIAFRQLATAI
jgi:transposase-like protein